ncbi:MAG: ATP-binding protein [Clostridiales bacterium]|nr:ATP-binding protein [Clostridiales bacterium]
MGTYLNPGNQGFQSILNGIYVDKTGLIDYINSTIDTPSKLTCFSRPRRFGKSFAAKMLCAYYDKSCSSQQLFDGLKISRADSFKLYLNKYNVIYLDITRFVSTAANIKNVVSDIQAKVIEELKAAYPSCVKNDEHVLADALIGISHEKKLKFIVIIDEWDALFRETKDDDMLQKEYVQLLRGLFKGGTATDETIAAAYMTGILPIKKYGTQSALTDFQEYTMTNSDELTEFVGFTETEVRKLCSDYHMDFEEMKFWYDGYSLSDTASVYSPNSVMLAIKRKRFRSYWTSSENYESLKNYINMNFDGLKDAIVAMLGGKMIRVKISRFQNDMTSFRSKDDILTLLIHLGYLTYDESAKKVYIPNQEVSESFQDAVEGDGWGEIATALSESEELLDATIRGDCAAVESALEDIHESNFSVLKYNDENSLSCAITLAYYTARNYYEIIRELPAGKGFADLAFLPRRNTDKPALLIELKYEKTADSAIRQISEKRYDGELKKHFGNLLLVGINYEKNKNGKRHTCVIKKT